MRKLVRTGLVLAVGIASVITLVTGCTEERQSDTKSIIAKTRLEANEKDAENRRLRKGIKDLKALHKKELKKQEKALAKCLRTKKSLEELSDKGVDEYMKIFLGPLVDENKKLREVSESLRSHVQALQKENDRLKREIARLQEEMQELRKEPRLPDKPQPL